MKKFLLIVAVLFISTSLFSQSDEEQSFAYCELVGTGKFMSTKVVVDIDFGQATKYFSSGKSRIVDENGKSRNFNSMVDALNFMGTLGWEFVQAYVVTSNNQNVYHWLVRKKITKDEVKVLLDMTDPSK